MRITILLIGLTIFLNGYAQKIKIRDVYWSIPTKSDLYSNPMEVGITIKTKTQFDVFAGLNYFEYWYYREAWFSKQQNQFVTQQNPILALRHGDSTAFIYNNVSYRGSGLRLGISKEFNLGKLQLLSRSSINPTIMQYNKISETGYVYYTDSVYSSQLNDYYPDVYKDNTNIYYSSKWAFSPQVSTELGAVFTMGKKFNLTPKVICTVAGRNGEDYLGNFDSNTYQIDLTMAAALHLSYRFNYFD